LQKAVCQIGLKRCENIITSACALGMMRQMKLEDEWTYERLLSHSYATACLASRINLEMKLKFQGEEFTAGLLHDVGRLLLALGMSETFRQIDTLDFIESLQTLDGERETINTTHAEIGAWFVKRMGLPERIVDSIRCHHEPENADPQNVLLVHLTAMSDGIANHLQMDKSPRDFNFDANRSVKFLLEHCHLHKTSLADWIFHTMMQVREGIRNFHRE